MALDVYELRITYRLDKVPVQNTYHFRVDQFKWARPIETAVAVWQGWLDYVFPQQSVALPTPCAYSRVRCRRVNNGGGPWFAAKLQLPDPGTEPGPLYTAVCPLITFAYEVGHGWKQKRLWFPGVWEGALIPNRLPTPQANLIVRTVAKLFIPWTVGMVDLKFGIWSRTHQQFALPVSVLVQYPTYTLKSRRARPLFN